MSAQSRWQEIRSDVGEFDWPDSPRPQVETLCPSAKAFAQDCQTILSHLKRAEIQADVKELRLLLLNTYNEAKATAGVPHSTYTGRLHRCLYHVWEATERELFQFERQLPEKRKRQPRDTRYQAPKIVGLDPVPATNSDSPAEPASPAAVAAR
jgi:hypothetical protein